MTTAPSWRTLVIDASAAPQRPRHCRIVLQAANGPCPLISLVNCLALRGDIEIPVEVGTDTTTADAVVNAITAFALDRLEARGAAIGDTAARVADIVATVPRMVSGMDVNVGFSGIDDFEPTPELEVFDALGLRLVHGWVADPSADGPVAQELHRQRYNALQVAMTGSVTANDTASGHDATERSAPTVSDETRAWLESSRAQLSYSGLAGLHAGIAEGEFVVLFRCGHFSVLTKAGGLLCTLVTDEALALDGARAWETLEDVDGSATRFLQRLPAAPGSVATSPPRVVHAVPVNADSLAQRRPATAPRAVRAAPQRRPSGSGCSVM